MYHYVLSSRLVLCNRIYLLLGASSIIYLYVLRFR